MKDTGLISIEQIASEILDAQSLGDDAVLSCFRKHRAQSVNDPEIKSLFDDVLQWYDESPNSTLAVFGKRALRRNTGDEFKDHILESMNGDLAGLELTTSTGGLYALFLPDASEPGRVRYQTFTERGFLGHNTHDSYEKALEDAVSGGFRELASGALDKLSVTPTFIEGNAFAARLALFHKGDITFEEVLDSGQQIKDQPSNGPLLSNGLFIGSKDGIDVYSRDEPGSGPVLVVRGKGGDASEREMSIGTLHSLSKNGHLSGPMGVGLQVYDQSQLTNSNEQSLIHQPTDRQYAGISSSRSPG